MSLEVGVAFYDTSVPLYTIIISDIYITFLDNVINVSLYAHLGIQAHQLPCPVVELKVTCQVPAKVWNYWIIISLQVN